MRQMWFRVMMPTISKKSVSGETVMTSDVINMRVPRILAKYDKSSYKIFLAQMKAILFGDPGVYMTKQRCEEFFDNDEPLAKVLQRHSGASSQMIGRELGTHKKSCPDWKH